MKATVQGILATIRNLALAAAAGAEVIEATQGVNHSIQSVALAIALGTHVIVASIDRYNEAARETPAGF